MAMKTKPTTAQKRKSQASILFNRGLDREIARHGLVLVQKGVQFFGSVEEFAEQCPHLFELLYAAQERVIDDGLLKIGRGKDVPFAYRGRSYVLWLDGLGCCLVVACRRHGRPVMSSAPMRDGETLWAEINRAGAQSYLPVANALPCNPMAQRIMRQRRKELAEWLQAAGDDQPEGDA